MLSSGARGILSLVLISFLAYCPAFAEEKKLSESEQAESLIELAKQFREKSGSVGLLQEYSLAELIKGKLSDDADPTGFWQDFANRACFWGDIKGCEFAYDQVSHRSWCPPGPLLDCELSKYRSADAIDFIVRNADSHNVIMIGEEHMMPQSRCLMLPILRELKKKGYEYFAAETFSDEISVSAESKYVKRHAGYYTEDPVFAEAVNEALKLGYKLVSYECVTLPEDSEKMSPTQKTNYREKQQASRLFAKTLEKNAAAKVLVWAGRGHVYTEIPEFTKKSDDQWCPMGYCFSQLAGSKPLSLILREFSMLSAEKESAEYRYAEDRGVIKTPTVFVHDENVFSDSGAATVFFPQSKFSRGRADWLNTIVGRCSVPIPNERLQNKFVQLVSVYETGRADDAVPIDCFVLQDGMPPPVMMLPRNGKFTVKMTNNRDVPMSEFEVSTVGL